MALQEAERRGQRPQYLDDDEVLTFTEWRQLNKLSERTARRIVAGPDSPVVTQLSERRIGITRGNNRAWQASRARGGAR